MSVQQQDMPLVSPETEAEERRRVEREEAIIAKGEADLRAGLGIEDEDLEAWLDLLDSDPNAPLPPPRNGSPFR